MRRILFYCGAILMPVIILSGCASPLQNISCIKSEGVNYIPKNIAIYPILSKPIGGGVDYRRQGLASMDSDAGVSARKYGENVVISPPAESDLRVTEESKIMTASLSVEMSALGFSLTQLPVEIFTDSRDDNDAKSEGRFFVTIDLLNRLQARNKLKAIIIGDVFFRNEQNHGQVEKKITFAHLKVVDITSLDILGQIFFPYDSEGVELNQATAKIAAQLADLAGLTDQGRVENDRSSGSRGF